MHSALFYTEHRDLIVRCQLCPHQCLIGDTETGICKARENLAGRLYSNVYGKLSALALDPVEKKPLYHFLPGSSVMSLGSVGCNLSCSFCQNAHISQTDVKKSINLTDYTAARIIELTIESGADIIAYTYNEPIIFFEFMLDTAKLARSKGMHNVMVSNGFINKEPLEQLIEFTDAFNLDIKAFSNSFYTNIAKASLTPVLNAIEQIAGSGKHLELTYLIVPGENDDINEFREMISWIRRVCGKDQVLHLSRYFPSHQMHKNSTPLSTIQNFLKIAREELNYVYPGNTGISFDSSTYCPQCRELLIERTMYTIKMKELMSGICINCGNKISGVFKIENL